MDQPPMERLVLDGCSSFALPILPVKINEKIQLIILKAAVLERIMI